jgi:hypothetical protein
VVQYSQQLRTVGDCRSTVKCGQDGLFTGDFTGVIFLSRSRQANSLEKPLVDEGRKRVLLITAIILAARKLKINMADEVFHYPQGAVDAFTRQLNGEARLRRYLQS